MAEFGFFGVRVITCRHTPRRKGEVCSAGDFDFVRIVFRPLLTSCLLFGIAAFGFARSPLSGETERGLLAIAWWLATSISGIAAHCPLQYLPRRFNYGSGCKCEGRGLRRGWV